MGFWWGSQGKGDHLEDPWRRWEDNNKMNFHEMGCGGNGLDQAGSGQGQVAGTCECRKEPAGSITYGEFLDKLNTG